MAIAADMKRLAEDIIGSYETRVRTIGGIVADTNEILGDAGEMIKRFAEERKHKSKELFSFLSDFVSDLTKEVDSMLEGFRNNHKNMSKEQEKSLTDFVNDLVSSVGSMVSGFADDREKMAKDLKSMLENYVSEIVSYTDKKLKEFHKDHADMSEELKKDLADYVSDIQDKVKRYLGDIRSDLQIARNAWDDMSAKLSTLKESGVVPGVSAGETVGTVEEVIHKKAKKHRKRKK